jgi:hypothetical protein
MCRVPHGDPAAADEIAEVGRSCSNPGGLVPRSGRPKAGRRMDQSGDGPAKAQQTMAEQSDERYASVITRVRTIAPRWSSNCGCDHNGGMRPL